MAGLLDFLGMGGQAQAPGAMQQPRGLSALLQPEIAMPMAAALLGGQGNAQNFGNAFGAGGQAFGQQKAQMAQKAQENRTIDFFRKNAPEYAQMIESGMPVSDAWQQYTKQRYAQPSLVNAGDGQLYDPASKTWISAPNSGQGKPPSVVELFDEGTGQPYKATWNAETGRYERVGGIKAPSGMQVEMGPDGQFTLTQGPLGSSSKPGTVDENKNAGFLIRGRDAHSTISQLEGQGTSLGNKVLRNIPGGLGNYGLTPEAQKFEQAKRDFVNAVLRRESGAVISEEEFANAEQQYFPQPGDSPEVIAQKRHNRENAIKGFEIGAGRAAGQAGPGPKRYVFNPETGELE